MLSVIGCQDHLSEDLFWCIAANLLGSDVRCITVFLLNFGVEDLASHDVDSIFAEQAERFGDSDRRNAVAGGVADILHGVDICWLLKREMFGRIKKLPHRG
jgi:hypothetical protein